MGAHIRFDERRAAFGDDLANSLFESDVVDDVLEQGETRRGLLVNATHHDQPTLGKFRSLGKSHCGFHVRDDRMAVVGLRVYQMARQFEAALSIDQQDQFPAESEERDIRVWAEAALAGEANVSIGRVLETRCDLGPGRIKLGARVLDVSAERAERVCVHAHGQAYHQPKSFLQDRRDHALLSVHGGQNRDGVFVRTIISRHGQK